ncbi:MAG TPA: PAS domain-containing protein, partial [Telluria sp.]
MLPVSTFQDLFASSPVAEALYSTHPIPLILAVNDAFLTVSARTAEDLVGRPLFEALPPDPDDEGESGVAALRASLQRVLATGQPDRLPLQRYPIRVQQADGSETYEVRYWSAINTPIFNADGQLVCIAHRTNDVTETKSLQDELAATLERQEFLLALADRLRPLDSPEDIAATASEMLCQELDIARVQYAEVDNAQNTFLIRCEWSAGAMPPVKGMSRLMDDFGPEVIAAFRRGDPVVVDDIRTDPRTAPFAGA